MGTKPMSAPGTGSRRKCVVLRFLCFTVLCKGSRPLNFCTGIGVPRTRRARMAARQSMIVAYPVLKINRVQANIVNAETAEPIILFLQEMIAELWDGITERRAFRTIRANSPRTVKCSTKTFCLLFLFRKLNNPEARNLTRRSLTGHVHGVVLAGDPMLDFKRSYSQERQLGYL
jgi:hypothetical protein